MQKLDGKSLDLAKENIQALKQLFPEIVTEGKIDFDKLKVVLGEEIETRKEKYEFTWHGKTQSLKTAQTPSTGTLRPDKESSKNWETTENLYIEGDNLEVLKLLQKSYFGKIKLIYIDPPYNTGNDFVYKDDFRDNIKNYKELTEQTTKANIESSGRYHTDWLNMIYPRLKLARNLLKEDGVVFISIDANEVGNLKKVCDEIFGEDNFEGIISWRRRHNQPNDKTKMIARVSEYILSYSKNAKVLKEKGTFYGLPLNQDRINEYTNPDHDPKGPWTTNPWKAAVGRGGSSYTIETPTGKIYSETWYGNKETFDKLLQENRVYWTANGDGYPRIKIYLEEALKKGQAAIDFFTHTQFGSNQEGSAELEEILNKKGLFDNPKPTRLLKSLIKLATKDNDLILDFFSGSGSTAHAVMQLNAEDDGNRKFIMIQLPEMTDEKSGANKAGYQNICEIGKDRIRRAGDKIAAETGKNDLDIGFKVFKLDSSNVKPWDPDLENLEENLFDLQDNIKGNRTKEDLLFEILLKIGISLTTPIEEIEFNGRIIYNVAYGSVLLCLENEIDLDIVNEMIRHKPEEFDTKVIFKESGFLNDSVKTNAMQTLKKAGINDVRSV
ncbi:MAG TPA: site-specific DNA-methyltransferase [Bacillus sp. (in: firmicutes)]|nr:site-specific DNA-methyltransferase [Bacillus sp. (in: firmicutes)]